MKREKPKAGERLRSVAIKRGDAVLHNGTRSHYELRQHLNPDRSVDPTMTVPGDIDGFITTAGRFVTRREALQVGLASGQIAERYRGMSRALLSSDINW